MFRLKFERPAKKAINFGWHHGRYADLWSLVHISSGVGAALLAYIFAAPVQLSAVVVLILAILYEFFEMWVGAVEDIKNSVTDILIAFVSFLMVYGLLVQYTVSISFSTGLFVGVLVFVGVLDYLGWEKYISKHTALEKEDAYVYILVSTPKVITLVGGTTLILLISSIF